MAHPRAGQSADIWEITAENNATANASCVMGWLADSQNVTTQAANIAAVGEEYKNIWAFYGTPEEFEARLNAYHDAMYNAGLQDVIDEYQSQVNAWMETNGK